MISLQTNENEKIIKMKIETNIPQSDIFEFLQKLGYEIKSWLWKFEDETFPNGISYHESWTFTATRNGEEQSEDTLFLTVFKQELTKLLQEFK